MISVCDAVGIICPGTHTDAAVNRNQASVVEKARDSPRGAVSLARAFLGRARCVGGFGSKKEGVPTTPAVPYSFQCYSTVLLVACFRTRDGGPDGMFGDPSAPLSSCLR